MKDEVIKQRNDSESFYLTIGSEGGETKYRVRLKFCRDIVDKELNLPKYKYGIPDCFLEYFGADLMTLLSDKIELDFELNNNKFLFDFDFFIAEVSIRN